jgi:outer membrane protein assembly factor BamA
MKYLLACLLALTGLHGAVVAQGETRVVIREIRLEGNRITRPKIILRELKFQAGDTVPEASFPLMVTQSRDNVFNTSLFNLVTVDTLREPGCAECVAVTVKVVERWYIWPLPYIAFPNHNINAWFSDPDFSRLTYGINLTFFNTRGRNETLTILLHFGFDQQYGFSYKTPYINKKQTWGFGFGLNFDLNRSLMVSTRGSKAVYMDTSGAFLLRSVSGFGELFFRPSLYTYHNLRLSYEDNRFADTLLSVEGFLTDSTLNQAFFNLWYKFKLDHRDARYYPLTGYYFDIEFLKEGFTSAPVNLFSVKSSLKKFWQLHGRWYFATGATGRISFPEDQPFYLQEGLGYGRDYVRGYEYYTLNAQHFAILKNNLKFALVPRRVTDLEFIRTPKFSVVPWGLYLNLFADVGYLYNPYPYYGQDNVVENSVLFGYGLGVDLATYYDVVIGLEGALNLMGEPGFYVHFIAPI